MHKIKLLFLSLNLLFSCPVSADEHQAISISEMWIREAPPSISVLAAYARIDNNSAKTQTSISVSSPSFSSIELHLSKTINDMATMEKQNSLMITAKGSVEFSPGGYHLMLFKPAIPLKVGDKATMTFAFADGASTTVIAIVKKQNNAEHEHNHGHHHQGNH